MLCQQDIVTFVMCLICLLKGAVSKSGKPGPGPVPKTRVQIHIFFITSLLRH